jgi:hypothetical protein
MRDPIIRGPKEYTEGRRKYRITAKGGLHKLRGNARPYFSLTGDVDRWTGAVWADDMGGCIHDEILKHWPELADLAALHLSDDTGQPMHAAGNGWYWMAGALGGVGERYHGGTSTPAKTPDECLRIFADHVRLSLLDAAKVRDEVRAVIDAVPQYTRVYEGGGIKAGCEWVERWCETQRERWAREAAECIARHGLVVYSS